MILAIETSASVCSVALCSDDKILKEYSSEAPMQHASLIGQYVEMILKEPDADIQLVSVAIGPGSFTGLRIGLSYAQGFCFGRNIPIIGISNHQVLASQINSAGDNYSIIDAHRNELYLAKHIKNEIFEIESHKIIALDDLINETTDNSNIACNKNLNLSIDVNTGRKIYKVQYSASLIAKIGMRQFNDNGADDIEKLEPMYIRPFAGML